ncbi:MAG TPA: Trm112 family protein [bacterium]|nr:Trm112 family protein [bacterium]
MVKEELLKILACPVCKDKVEYDKKKNEIVCTVCGRRYPVEDGIPIMLVERAEKGDS